MTYADLKAAYKHNREVEWKAGFQKLLNEGLDNGLDFVEAAEQADQRLFEVMLELRNG